MTDTKNSDDVVPTGAGSSLAAGRQGTWEPPKVRSWPAPHSRGIIAPVVGNPASSEVIRAFAHTGGGWLHVDGLAVSMGSYDGTEPMRAIPDARVLVDRLTAHHDVIEHIRDHEMERQRQEEIDRYGNDRMFESDDISVQVYERFPLSLINDSLAEAGWHRISVLEDRGVVEVRSIWSDSVPPGILRSLSRMAEELGGRLAGRLASQSTTGPYVFTSDGDTAKPDPSDYEDITADTFAGLAGFKSYDSESRTITFLDRDVTVTLPGGIAPGEEPGDTRAPGR